jgi:transposase
MLVGVKAYPQELRDRVLEAQDTGESSTAVGRRLRVSPAYVRRVWQRRRQGGETTARPAGGPRHLKLDRDLLAWLQAEKPDATIVEIQHLLADRFGVRVATGTICQALKGLRLSFKRSR